MTQLKTGLALTLAALFLVTTTPSAGAGQDGGRIRFTPAQDYPSATVTYNGTASPGAVTRLYRNGRADKYPDLVLANIVGGPVLLYGVGSGRFAKRTVVDNGDTDASAVGVADFNGDRVPDIVSGGYTTGRLTVVLGRRDGSYRVGGSYPLQGVWPSHFEIADLDADGHLDIATTAYGGGRITILLGNGDGTFRRGESATGTTVALAMVVADLTGDGVPDIAVTESLPTIGKLPLLGGTSTSTLHGTVRILRGNGDGTFRRGSSYDIGVLSELVRYGDVNEDGRGDLVILNALVGNDASILYGLGGGRFAPERRIHVGGPQSVEAVGVRTLDGSEGLQLVDLNGDGHLDMALTQMISSTVILFAGDGRGHFDLVSQQRVTGFPEDLMAGDLDGDGCLDLAVPGNVPPVGPADVGVARVSVLLNRSPGCGRAVPVQHGSPSPASPGSRPPTEAERTVQLSVVSVVLPHWW